MALPCLALLLAGCARTPGYPHDWPPASPDLYGCPDLSGEYDGVDANLPALLAPERNFGKRFQHEHSVLIERDATDGHYTLTLRRNARGLAAFREWHLEYNQDSTADGGFVRIELDKGEDYECSRGWFIGSKWSIMEQPRGDPRHLRLALAKDGAGNLIAAVTTRDAQDRTQWLRWPKRAPDAEAQLRAAGSVSLVRYPVSNARGKRVPTRFANYTPDAICVDSPHLPDVEVRLPPRPSIPQPRAAASPAPPPHCPDNELKLDQGDVVRIDMPAHAYTTVNWHPLGKPRSAGGILEIEAPEDLPGLEPGH